MTDFDPIKILPDADQLARYTAERIVRMAGATLEYNEYFSIALSGGSTPEPVYRLLGTSFRETLDWSRIHIFWGDERCVPPDHDDSNYHMTHKTLLQHVPIPKANVHRMRGEDDPTDAALAYEAEIRDFFADEGQLFDLNLLGMGGDGHTASLFPHTAALNERDRWVMAHHVETKGDLWRITLTFPAILASANIMFLVSGERKADAVYEVLEGEENPSEYPSQTIARSDHDHVIFALDEGAAAKLP